MYFKTCPNLLEIYNKRPASTQDRLFLSLSQCGYRDGQPLVCCREQAVAPPPTQPPPPPQPPQPIPGPGPVPIPPTRNNLLPRSPECGIDAENRIYGGNETYIDVSYQIDSKIIFNATNYRSIHGSFCSSIRNVSWVSFFVAHLPDFVISTANNRKGFHCGGVLIR